VGRRTAFQVPEPKPKAPSETVAKKSLRDPWKGARTSHTRRRAVDVSAHCFIAAVASQEVVHLASFPSCQLFPFTVLRPILHIIDVIP
jgi:hypothetical protein